MNQPLYRSQFPDDTRDNVMKPEQFTQVIEAILAGKYSWACVLILQFGGYNPLHYIPYRTYNRLVKDNAQCRKRKPAPVEPVRSIDETTKPERENFGRIKDLAYLEVVSEPQKTVRGGYFQYWFGGRI